MNVSNAQNIYYYNNIVLKMKIQSFILIFMCISIIQEIDAFQCKYFGKSTFRIPMSMKLSPLIQSLEISKTIEIHALTKAMEKNNEKVFSLCVGEPDYEPPIGVIEAIAKAAKIGKTKYTSVTGEVSLRNAIANDLNSRKGLIENKYSADSIVVANGAKQAVVQALMTVVSPNERVIIPAPYWTSYPDMVKICQGIPLVITTSVSNNYILTGSELRSALESNPNVSCIILCNPSNPTGSVATKEQQLELAKVLEDYPDITVISDEIYDRLTYDNHKHVSFASLPNMFERTITINGFSKSHSMTGFRIGYSASNNAIAKEIGKLQSQLTSCASSVSQYAAEQALQDDKDPSNSWHSDRLKELEAKRDFAYKMLLDIPHVTCPKPIGAFYLLPDISYYFNKKTAKNQNKVTNSHELCLEFLRDEKVAVVSGDAFGAPNCLRLSYATSLEVIEESLKRLKSFLLSLSI